ncbi:hypothetical protein BDW59DRAFT_170909 [Aspergillus cavernicola]|uniref:Saccharopine dehydrogenase NADP binding domain-containing protein n=1 Tax=Aspergillus cavernicola TaxID=176166 RepID=A0ABR4IME3_9EURO
MASSRALDLVLLGPTGYTGKLCAEHITQHLPSDLKWAIAGHSAEKLQTLRSNLQGLHPSRLEPVVEACVNNGTYYVDVTGETPWVRELIAKYHETAKSTGAIIIPSTGVENAPPDLLSWALVKCIQDNLSVGVQDMIIATHEMKASGASGGTLSTILKFKAQPKPKKIAKKPLAQTLFGARFVPEFGILTTSPAEMCDIATVYRSSTMMPEFYGPDFCTEILVKVRSMFVGILIYVGFRISLLALLLPPVRWLVKKFIYAPGQGPSAEGGENDRLAYCHTSTARTHYRDCEGHPWWLCDSAVLGQEFVDRLGKVGVSIETKILDS